MCCGVVLGHLVPVDHIPPRLEVVGALVLVLEVVGVFPDVAAEDGFSFGAGDGLAVTRSGDTEVTVTAGTAIDRSGRELVLLDDRVLSLADSAVYPAGATVHVTIAYHEEQSDPSTATGVTGNTRVTERPEVRAVTSVPPGDGSVIRLGQFTLRR